ncbi:hypothetical protein [Stieleria mannarensis]|uniref:hypothetical protein n=1 Tax=Stieleria mannarensis TaxID=2755585 RepID=UPI0016006F7C|nr:hypothetical protein [Rhodopirellula sp. JC639]
MRIRLLTFDVSPRIVLCALLVLACVPRGNAQTLKDVPAESITAEMLWDRWVENQQGRLNLPPLKLVMTRKAIQMQDQGIDHKQMEVYAAPPDYLVTHGEYVPTEGSQLDRVYSRPGA